MMNCIHKLLDSIPIVFSLGILIFFCFSGTLICDLMATKYFTPLNLSDTYINNRILILSFTFIGLFLCWLISSSVTYFCAIIFNGTHNSIIYFKNTSSALFIGIIFFFIDLFIINKYDTIIFLDSANHPVYNEVFYLIRRLNYIMYFIISCTYIIIIRYTMNLSWDKSILSVIIPFCLIFWSYKLVSILTK